MNRIGFENASFMIGPEVEHTPAYSKRTLFVIGQQNIEQIEQMAKEHKTPHIFMGANHSFSIDQHDWNYWDDIITKLLDKGFWVTLDYPAHLHEQVLKILNKGIWQSRLFVPLLSVRIPHVQTSSINLTVKIDDVDFKATNPGVWCMNHHEITDSNRFTDWRDYGTDEVINFEEKATPMPPFVAAPDPALKVDVKSLKDLAPPVIKKSESDAKNDLTPGLDTTSPSQLKPENEEEKIQTPIIESTKDVAESYATNTDVAVETSKEQAKKTKGKA